LSKIKTPANQYDSVENGGKKMDMRLRIKKRGLHKRYNNAHGKHP
jgi:hypothetical protein